MQGTQGNVILRLGGSSNLDCWERGDRCYTPKAGIFTKYPVQFIFLVTGLYESGGPFQVFHAGFNSVTISPAARRLGIDRVIAFCDSSQFVYLGGLPCSVGVGTREGTRRCEVFLPVMME